TRRRPVTARVAIYPDLFFSSGRRHTSFSRDWSSDVCSSDPVRVARHDARMIGTSLRWLFTSREHHNYTYDLTPLNRSHLAWFVEIGRASCRERVEVWQPGGAGQADEGDRGGGLRGRRQRHGD